MGHVVSPPLLRPHLIGSTVLMTRTHAAAKTPVRSAGPVQKRSPMGQFIGARELGDLSLFDARGTRDLTAPSRHRDRWR